jgi:arginyl-tRNA synthetase
MSTLKIQLQKAIFQTARKFSSQLKLDEIQLEYPANPEFGDYSSNIAMILAKKAKKNPLDLAKLIVKEIKNNETMKQCSNISFASPGFINFFLKTEFFLKELRRVLKLEDKYGSSGELKGKKILLEHTSPDPIKTMHIGHLRNNFLGMSMAKIFEFQGAKVVLDCINNDRGTHVCQAIMGYLAFARKNSGLTSLQIRDFVFPKEKIKEILKDFNWQKSLENWMKNKKGWLTPRDLGLKSDHFDLRVYAAASKAVKQSPGFKKGISQMLIAWEKEDKQVRRLWRRIIAWSLHGYEKTYKRIGSYHDYVWHESNLYQEGKEMVYEGLKKGIFQKSKGAIVTNLIKYNLPDTVMIKSNGTALYITFDINLTKKKKEKFPSDLYIWDIGNDQKLYLRQQFAVCEQLGMAKLPELFHLNYGYVRIKGKGKMSSREGTIVSADDLIDLLVKKAKRIRGGSVRGKLGKGSEAGEKQEIDEIVGLAALKYGMLKDNRMTDMEFDIDESISLQGNSGPYLQYTYARCQSVLRKSSTLIQQPTIVGNYIKVNQEEEAVLRTFYKFPEVVLEAGEKYGPNLLCNFLYALAQKYNTFYNKHRILKTTMKKYGKATIFRLDLTRAVSQILKTGLYLLGIKTPAKM